MELENLLPYNVRYTIFDRDSNQTWSSYLRQGGLMPIHSVELTHLILLSLTIQDAGMFAHSFCTVCCYVYSDRFPTKRIFHNQYRWQVRFHKGGFDDIAR